MGTAGAECQGCGWAAVELELTRGVCGLELVACRPLCCSSRTDYRPHTALEELSAPRAGVLVSFCPLSVFFCVTQEVRIVFFCKRALINGLGVCVPWSGKQALRGPPCLVAKSTAGRCLSAAPGLPKLWGRCRGHVEPVHCHVNSEEHSRNVQPLFISVRPSFQNGLENVRAPPSTLSCAVNGGCSASEPTTAARRVLVSPCVHEHPFPLCVRW